MDVNFELGDLKFVWDSEKVMNSFIKKIPPLSAEEIAEIRANAPKSDEEIDLSDIPETTEEEFARMKENRRRRKKLQVAS
ncbi:MAG: hypothetical protein IKZ58_02835 [Selenomonadaceae bacterium]|nr:hypothetical protein [Selenomonadaceae bacterium]